VKRLKRSFNGGGWESLGRRLLICRDAVHQIRGVRGESTGLYHAWRCLNQKPVVRSARGKVGGERLGPLYHLPSRPETLGGGRKSVTAVEPAVKSAREEGGRLIRTNPSRETCLCLRRRWSSGGGIYGQPCFQPQGETRKDPGQKGTNDIFEEDRTPSSRHSSQKVCSATQTRAQPAKSSLVFQISCFQKGRTSEKGRARPLHANVAKGEQTKLEHANPITEANAADAVDPELIV